MPKWLQMGYAPRLRWRKKHCPWAFPRVVLGRSPGEDISYTFDRIRGTSRARRPLVGNGWLVLQAPTRSQKISDWRAWLQSDRPGPKRKQDPFACGWSWHPAGNHCCGGQHAWQSSDRGNIEEFMRDGNLVPGRERGSPLSGQGIRLRTCPHWSICKRFYWIYTQPWGGESIQMIPIYSPSLGSGTNLCVAPRIS